MWELVGEENKSLPKEIWVHTLHTGKFGGTEQSIHYDEGSAIKQQAVLGGSIEKFVKCED